jgi:hypothetical protein
VIPLTSPRKNLPPRWSSQAPRFSGGPRPVFYSTRQDGGPALGHGGVGDRHPVSSPRTRPARGGGAHFSPTLPLSRRARARARVSDGNQRPWPADKVERWSIDRLIPYAKNARTHSDAQIAAIARQTGAPRCRRLGGDVPPAGHCPRPVAGLDRNQRTGAQDAELCPKRAAGEVSRLGPVCRSARHSTHPAGGSGISVISTCIGAGREAHRTTPAPAARASTRPGRTTSPSTSPLRGNTASPKPGDIPQIAQFCGVECL